VQLADGVDPALFLIVFAIVLYTERAARHYMHAIPELKEKTNGTKSAGSAR
jgi:hypothetical protein